MPRLEANFFKHGEAAGLVLQLVGLMQLVTVKDQPHLQFFGVTQKTPVWIVQCNYEGELVGYFVHGATHENGAAMMVLMHEKRSPCSWAATRLTGKDEAKARHDKNGQMLYEQMMAECDAVDAAKAAKQR